VSEIGASRESLFDMDRSVVLNQHDQFDSPARYGTVEAIELFEIATKSLLRSRAGVDESWRVT
jgi:hypothetical protein